MMRQFSWTAGIVCGLALCSAKVAPVASAQQGPASAHVLRFSDKAYVELKDTKGLLNLNSSFTAELWVRWDANVIGEMSLMGDEAWATMNADVPVGSNCGWVFRTTPVENFKRGLDFTIGTSIQGKPDWFRVLTATRADADKWQHVAVSKSSDAIRIYWNGKLAAFRACRGVPFLPCPTDLYLGVRKSPYDRRRFEGAIGAFRLSSTGRYTHNFTPPRTFERDKNALTLLDFSQGNGDVLHDLSGHGHEGKIVGAEWVEPFTDMP